MELAATSRYSVVLDSPVIRWSTSILSLEDSEGGDVEPAIATVGSVFTGCVAAAADVNSV